jgi:hypothetical protein
MSSSKHSAIKFIFFSFICFLLSICTIEILLRTTHLFGARVSCSKPDPVLSWRFLPHCNYWHYKENDHPITGKINSYGWRDKEWTLKKSPNTYRIAVLGDSYVQALEIESDKTFLALTEHKLYDLHSIKTELMNFGLAGFTQTEELIVLKNDVIKFLPDMVVLFFFPSNDIDDIYRDTAQTSMRPFYNVSNSGELILDTSYVDMPAFKIRSLISRIKQHSALISLMTERYNTFNILQSQKNNEHHHNKINGYLSLFTLNPDPKYLRNYALNKLLIKAMAEFCREKRIKFVLVTIDNIAYIPENEYQYISIDASFNANFIEDDLKTYSKLLNIDYLGLQRIFRKTYLNTGVALHWGHWNYHGHELVANALTDKLITILSENEELNLAY